MSGTLYTCGRMHKPHKLKLRTPSVKAAVVIDAVCKLMQEELSEARCDRWCSRLNAELGEGVFNLSSEAAPDSESVPQVWVPAKPKLALALLDEFLRDGDDLYVLSPKKRIGVGSTVSKLLTRRVVERLCREKGIEWLKASDELAPGQLNDGVRLNQALSRVAFDLVVYVHARAVELARKEEADVVLALHSSDQTVVGRAMRGCGVVYCEEGRAMFARAAALVREALA